jgi:hypothetical protein
MKTATKKKLTEGYVYFSGYDRWGGRIFFNMIGKDKKGKKLVVTFKLEFNEKESPRTEFPIRAEIRLGNIYYPYPDDIHTIKSFPDSLKDLDIPYFETKVQEFFKEVERIPINHIVNKYYGLSKNI